MFFQCDAELTKPRKPTLSKTIRGPQTTADDDETQMPPPANPPALPPAKGRPEKEAKTLYKV